VDISVVCDVVGSRQSERAYALVLFLQENVPNKVDIKVTRSNIFEDSYRSIMSIKRADILKTK